MEDEVVEQSWVSHLSQCPMCSFMIFQHQNTGRNPREILGVMRKKLNDWKEEHHGKEWNGYEL